MDFKNSTDSFFALSERVKRLAQQFNIIDSNEGAKKSVLGTYRDNENKPFYMAMSKMADKRKSVPVTPGSPDVVQEDKTIKDGSKIYDKGLQVGGAATTENGLPVEPGTYRLKDGSIIVVGGGGLVISRKRG